MIRNLSSRLRTLSTMPAQAAPPPQEEMPLWRIVRRYPLAHTVGRAQLSALLQVGVSGFSLLSPGEAFDPHAAVYLDTETTGLSGGVGTLAFLVGMGYLEGEEFVVEQLLLRDYCDEGAVLAAVAERISGRALVTYNGASFDLPLLRARMIMNRLQEPLGNPHTDLLTAARRVYKLRLRKCALTDIESGALGFVREDDLPGREAPERFFRFLRTREEELLLEVARHNAQDIVSLAALHGQLARLASQPEEGHRADAVGIGRLHERAGQLEWAERCYRIAAAGRPGSAEGMAARWALHRLYRRTKRPQEERDALLSLVDARVGGQEALLALAKVCEHRLKDYPTALYAVDEASQRARESGDAALLEELSKRRARIVRRAGKQSREDGVRHVR